VGQKHLSGTKDVILIPNDLQHIDSAGLILTWTQPKSQWIARTERQKVATLSWLSSFGSRRLQFFAPVLLAIDRSNVAGPFFHTALSALASGDGGTAHAHPMGKWRRCGR